MNTFIIPAHGVVKAPKNPHLSYAQYCLLNEPKPIRLCGSPTGAGKTYALIEAARQGQAVFFVVPTQTLADDTQAAVAQYNTEHKLEQPIRAAIWDGRQSLRALTGRKVTLGRTSRGFSRRTDPRRYDYRHIGSPGSPDYGFAWATKHPVEHD